ncbi:hypothetical protein F2P56_003498 [Juglans regia]|uniref:Inactive poly [ADP-ribose] polymerase SRO5 n=2 Tax=Juglans regia TaxID=51240 RepID=A0A833XTR7_JUGRE|nr:probable inactive poly [ADP-ribose] polymerase SRO5 [Juglans regia]KAF5476801.1 hypothetical protein F2P56_003498 [Juglans regia]
MENINGDQDQCRLALSPIGNMNSSPHGFQTSTSNSLSEQESDEQFGQTSVEDSESDTITDQEASVSDCESSVSGSPTEHFPVFDDLVRLAEGDRVYDLVKRRFVLGFASLGVQAKVVGIHRNDFGGLMGQARLNTFRIYGQAMEKKCGGNANIRYAWYGASKDDIVKIASHGFGHCGISQNNGLFGGGVYLSPDYSPLESACNSVVDKDGLRHLLLSRVILGKAELVQIGSEQCHPSSEEFDSAVDNLSAPRKYIVWSTHMNTHILPEFVISFRAPSCLAEFARIPKPSSVPTSPWVPFPVLISVLSKFLPPHTVSVISKYHEAHKEKKISRNQLVLKLRQIAGDKLLIAIIKSFKSKQLKTPTSLA